MKKSFKLRRKTRKYVNKKKRYRISMNEYFNTKHQIKFAVKSMNILDNKLRHLAIDIPKKDKKSL